MGAGADGFCRQAELQLVFAQREARAVPMGPGVYCNVIAAVTTFAFLPSPVAHFVV